MKKGVRPLMVAREIRSIVAEILKEKINDPRLQNLSVYEVNVSNDLKFCEISLYSLRETNKDVEKILENAGGFFRSEIAKRLRIKHMPEIKLRLIREEEKTW